MEERSSSNDRRNDDRPRCDPASHRLLHRHVDPVHHRWNPADHRRGVVDPGCRRTARRRQKSLVLVHDAESVSPLVRRAAEWSWRLLVILAAAVVVFEVIRRFGLVVVPVALALMLAAMLLPAVDFLDRYGAARGGAVAFVVILGLTAFVGILAFVISQFVDGLPGLVEQVTNSIDTLRNWLIDGPIHLSRDQINHA